MSQPVKPVAIDRVESNDPFQVRASHDQRSHQVYQILRYRVSIPSKLGDLQLAHMLRKEASSAQCPPQQLQAHTHLHLVLFDAVLRVVPYYVYSIVPK